MFTSGLKGNGTDGNFKSDNTDYFVRLTSEGEAEIPPARITVSVDGLEGIDGGVVIGLQMQGSWSTKEKFFSEGSAPQTYDVPYGKTVTLKAGTLDGGTFVNWSENGVYLSDATDINWKVDDDRTLVAHYNQDQIRVKAELEGRDWQDDEACEFTLAAVDAGAPMPKDEGRRITITKDNASLGTSFGKFGFVYADIGKTIRYGVTQKAGDVFGTVYDTAQKTVTYTIVEREGGGTIDVLPSRFQTVTFTNRQIPPTVTGDASLSYGKGGSIAVAIDKDVPTEGFDLSYQWYACDADGGNPVAIKGANGESYALPAGLDAGDHYYLCEVTGKRNETTTTVPSAVAKVTVAPAALTVIAEPQSKVEGEVDPALTYEVYGLVKGG